MSPLPAGIPTVRERVAVGDLVFDLIRPTSAEELIDEDEYAVDERLPYWADLWPSGRVLADAFAADPPTGSRVVELGCGLAVPSLVAAALGARVTATDWYAPALAFVAENARAAGVRVDTLLVDWRDPPTALFAAGPFDLVVAADVLYEARNAPPLAALVPRLCAPRGEVLIADPRRPDARAFLDGMVRDGWMLETTDVAFAGRRDETGSTIHVHRLRPPGA